MKTYRGWKLERVTNAYQCGGNYCGKGRHISGWLAHYPDSNRSKWCDTLDDAHAYIDRYLDGESLVGSRWDTNAGNIWEVVETLPNNRIRVKCVAKSDGSPLRKWDGPDCTHVWAADSLFGTSAVRVD